MLYFVWARGRKWKHKTNRLIHWDGRSWCRRCHNSSFAFFIGAAFFAIFFCPLLFPHRLRHRVCLTVFHALSSAAHTKRVPSNPHVSECFHCLCPARYEIRISILITRHHIDIRTKCRKSSTSDNWLRRTKASIHYCNLLTLCLHQQRQQQRRRRACSFLATAYVRQCIVADVVRTRFALTNQPKRSALFAMSAVRLTSKNQYVFTHRSLHTGNWQEIPRDGIPHAVTSLSEELKLISRTQQTSQKKRKIRDRGEEMAKKLSCSHVFAMARNRNLGIALASQSNWKCHLSKVENRRRSLNCFPNSHSHR